MTDTIKNTITGFADGFVFTAEDFPIPSDKQNTVISVPDEKEVATTFIEIVEQVK
jgi:hypothetical protein